ncbi:MAG: TadE/TadG family type IV pilus assembly protein [Terracidiphilus sp.]
MEMAISSAVLMMMLVGLIQVCLALYAYTSARCWNVPKTCDLTTPMISVLTTLSSMTQHRAVYR